MEMLDILSAPWEVRAAERGLGRRSYKIFGADGDPILETEDHYYLMAAAPDLYKALQNLTNLADGREGSKEWRARCLGEAKSALAKAEGL